MPRQNDGKFVIIQNFNDGQYLKSSLITPMLNDVSLGLNDLYLPLVFNSKFKGVINLPQMTGVVTGTTPDSAVAYSTTSNYTFPIGGIVMYTYQSFYSLGMPNGFAMCDGNANTPDLLKKFNLEYFYIMKIN